MRAIEIAKLDKLMADKAWITIGDDEMPIAFLDGDIRAELRRPCARGIHQPGRGQVRSIVEKSFAAGHPRNGTADKKRCALPLRCAGKLHGHGRRICDGILGH